MNKTKIEWADYTINPVKGLCPVACKDNQGKEYCYARRMYKRFKWNPEIRLVPLLDIHLKPNSRIFVGSTMELFGNWIKEEWLSYIFKWVRAHPQHAFLFLTKNPDRLVKWSPFPDNCFVGVSATNQQQSNDALQYLLNIKARIKYISYEPLLEHISFYPGAFLNGKPYIHQVIIGAQTQPYRPPAISDVEEIVGACDKAGIFVFLKDNLKPLLPFPDYSWAYIGYGGNYHIRQELPR